AITNEKAPDAANRGIAKLVSTEGLEAGDRSGWTRVTAEEGAALDLVELPFEGEAAALDAITTDRDSVEAYLDLPAYDVAQQCLAAGYDSAGAADPADQLMHIVGPNLQGSMALPGP